LKNWRPADTTKIWEAPTEPADVTAHPGAYRTYIKPYPDEYVATVVFARNYGDDEAVLAAKGVEATPEEFAKQLNRELQEACDQWGSPAGRWQVARVEL
jgi:hypothetical protein